MLRRASILAALLLGACDSAPPPSAAPAAAPKAPKAPVEEKKADTSTGAAPLEYSYSPVGKRDPFRSILDDEAERPSDQQVDRNCGPLCKWELEQLKLVAVISGVSNPLGMVEDPKGRGYVVRRGTFMGKRNGKVTQIRSGEIVVTEIFKDNRGAPHLVQKAIKLPADKEQPTSDDDQNLLGPEVAQ